MPQLDRIITIEKNTPMRNQQGEQVDDWEVVHQGWASRMDLGASDKATVGGQLAITVLSFTVRYNAELLNLNPSLLRITEGTTIHSVNNVVEDPGEDAQRRRFIRFETVAEVT